MDKKYHYKLWMKLQINKLKSSARKTSDTFIIQFREKAIWSCVSACKFCESNVIKFLTNSFAIRHVQTFFLLILVTNLKQCRRASHKSDVLQSSILSRSDFFAYYVQRDFKNNYSRQIFLLSRRSIILRRLMHCILIYLQRNAK